MIICQCNGISDRAIRKAVRDGASNRNDVVRACTAGMACGGCVPAIEEIIDAEQERVARSSLIVLELATG
jgi:bacterioferritin-associated ferredoxin